jgi:mannose-6-phosphate isomerase-like protein (cupin superfamily)
MLPFNQRIKKLAKANHDFRREVFTTSRLQVVLMSLQPGEEIGLETHEDTDQVFYIVKGEGYAAVGDESHAFERGSLVVVPAGTPHNLVNDSGESLKLFTLYVPPHHAPGTVHATRKQAREAEAAEAKNATTRVASAITQ